jgi:opacity protein-like surface antigen
MRKTLIATTAALMALLLAPAAAPAVVQPQRSISGVALGMTQAQVRAALGTPRVSRGSNDFGPFTVFRYAGGLTVRFQGNARVSSVETTGLGDRTVRGVGVGSTEAIVRARVAGVRCVTESGFRHCHLGQFLAGRRVTDFAIANGRVTRILVGVVID